MKTQDCWLWARGLNSDGYGSISISQSGKTKNFQAHRVMYENVVGDIPEGLQIDHLCRTPSCINPEHLEPVTPHENMLRGQAPPAINKRKTKCIRGHTLKGQNLYITPSNKRNCKTCRSKAIKQWWKVNKG